VRGEPARDAAHRIVCLLTLTQLWDQRRFSSGSFHYKIVFSNNSITASFDDPYIFSMQFQFTLLALFAAVVIAAPQATKPTTPAVAPAKPPVTPATPATPPVKPAATCKPGEMKCGDDALSVQFCNADSTWFALPCENGSKCAVNSGMAGCLRADIPTATKPVPDGTLPPPPALSGLGDIPSF
jgi:hypothetical protein